MDVACGSRGVVEGVSKLEIHRALFQKRSLKQLHITCEFGNERRGKKLSTCAGPSQVTVTGLGVSETHRSGQVSGQGFQKNAGEVQVSGQWVPKT